MSKGSNRRPEDKETFDSNFDRIFTGKVQRGSWVYKNGELVPKEEYVPESGVMVIPDIQPYKSMVTGEMITSRSHHRDHLKRHNKIEIGNEIKAHMSQAQQQYQPDKKGIREAVIRAAQQHIFNK